MSDPDVPIVDQRPPTTVSFLTFVMVVSVALVALVHVPVAASPTLGTQAEDAEELVLVSQSAFVSANGLYRATIDLGRLATLATVDSGPVDEEREDGPTVAITVYSVVSDPALLDAEPSVPINRMGPRPLSELSTTPEGLVTIEMPVREGEPFDDIERMRLPDPGVYPVEIEISDGADALATLRTNLIRLPLDESLVSPITASFIVTVGGTEGIALDEAVEILEAFPSAPITVVFGSGVIDQLGANRASATALADALNGRAVLARPRPFLDPSAVAAIGQAGLFQQAFEASMVALSALGLTPLAEVDVISAQPTAAGTSALLEAGVTLAIDGESLAGAVAGSEVAAGGRLAANDGSLRWLAANPIAAGFLTAPDRSPALRTAQLLAALTLSPDRPDPMVIAIGAGFDQPTETLRALLTAFDGSGPARIATLADAANALAVEELAPAPNPAQDLSESAASLAAAQELLATYEAFYIEGPNPPLVHRATLSAALGLDQTPETRRQLIDTTTQALDGALTVISLPENQAVTLAAQSVPIPLTIENDSLGTRQVMLRFRSDKIVVAEDGQLITIGPGTSSIDIQVEARSLGVSPLQVSVLTPDGRHVLATTRFRVRSTAVPGLGLLISAVGLGLLAVWWYLSIRRRRNGGLDDTSADDDTPDPDGDQSTPPTRNGADPGVDDGDRTLASDSV